MNFEVSGLSGSLSPEPPESAPEAPNETDGVLELESADRAPNGPSTGSVRVERPWSRSAQGSTPRLYCPL
jgi:hypothetical protein